MESGDLRLVSDRTENDNVDPLEVRKLSVLMPVFNERWTLETIIERVLTSPVDTELELILVDDCSTDGSWEVAQELAKDEPRLRIFRHRTNQGKGAAIRTAIEQVSGDVVVIQDADLEYNPHELPALLEPIQDGRADAVFGSRFAGHSRRVLYFWHSVANKILTLISNMLNDLNLSDMETCYKMIRTDILKQLRLKSNSFTLEPELTSRLAQWGARIYEVPISYHGRTYYEGKKIRASDGIKALWTMFRCKFLDPRFTTHSGYYILKSVAKADSYNRWILQQVKGFLGPRLLEAGSGIGNLSQKLLNRERLVLVDYDPMYISTLKRQYAGRKNIRVDRADLTASSDFATWKDEKLDTIFCSNVLEHLEPDVQVLGDFCKTLVPGGHCIIVVPAGQWLYTGMDEELGHFRRYSHKELADKMKQAGLEVVYSKQFSRLASVAWGFSGHVLRKRALSPLQMIVYDRIMPVAKIFDHCLPVPGMSLVMVGRKPAAQAHAAVG